jgi:hypothetical protein
VENRVAKAGLATDIRSATWPIQLFDDRRVKAKALQPQSQRQAANSGTDDNGTFLCH